MAKNLKVIVNIFHNVSEPEAYNYFSMKVIDLPDNILNRSLIIIVIVIIN